MYSAFKFPGRCAATACLVLACTCSGQAAQLRVCADPNNLPYSNIQRQGFENQLAEMIAKDMGLDLSYIWYPQWEKFFGRTLNSGVCDVVMGVPFGISEASTTRSYYRSSYVFVSRRDRNLEIRSFDDPRLKSLHVGVHVLGDGDANVPPMHALSSRGIIQNVTGYSIFGNLNEKNPAADLIAAVSNGKVDVAIAWGPLAGYFARQATTPLRLTAIESDPALPDLPMSFDIAVGVRKGSDALRNKLDAELTRRRIEIQRMLRSYGVPEEAVAVTPAHTTLSESRAITREDD